MNKAWNWTVFQLMTQAAMQEEDKKDASQITPFLANLLNNNSINLPSLYK